MVKRARTRCRVDLGFILLIKKTKKKKTRGINWEQKRQVTREHRWGNNLYKITNNQETRWESTQ